MGDTFTLFTTRPRRLYAVSLKSTRRSVAEQRLGYQQPQEGRVLGRLAGSSNPAPHPHPHPPVSEKFLFPETGDRSAAQRDSH